MFADFLFCVFSYNRGDFLENLLESIQRYYPEASIAIFDDGSQDAKVLSIIDNAKSNGQYVHVTDKSNPDCKHGGLYYMMNVAINYAKASSYKYAYFVQDDMQLLWRDEQLHNRLSKAFSYDNCVMCNFNFLQKIFKYDAAAELHDVNTEGMYSFAKHGVGDTGVIDLDKARAISLEFPFHAERENGEYWYAKGYRMFWLSQSNLAWLPWPKVYRYKEAARGKIHRLRFENDRLIEKLKTNTTYTYTEDFLTTDSILIKPYWNGDSPGTINLLKIYVKYFLGMRLINNKKEM